jgi:hypothetical protein
MITWLKNNWLIAVVLVIAFLLRFVPLFEYEFFFDELSSLSRIPYDSVKDIIDKGVKVDVHPALIQLFVFYWAKIGGTSEVWIKLPFLICGFLSCWFTFIFAKKWFDYKTGVIAATVVSCSMIFLVYSSSSHLYSTAVLFGILSTSYLFEIVFGSSVKKKDYILFGIFVLLGALNHHMGALYGAIIGMLAIIFAPKKQKIYLLCAAAGAALLYLPHLSITLAQMKSSISADSGGWLTAPKWDACFLFIKTLFGTGIVVSAFIALFIYGGYENKYVFKSDKKIIFLFASFLIYCLVVYFYSIYKNPILQFSVLLIAAPCFVIVVARAISFIPDKVFNMTAIALVVAFLVQTIYIKQYFKLGIKQGVKSAIVETIGAKEKYGKDNVAAIYNTEPFFVEKYLADFKQKYSYLSAFDPIFAKQEQFGNYLKSRKEQFIILSDPDAIYLERVKSYFPYVIKHEEGYFRNIYLLSKKNENAINDDAVVNTFNLANKGNFVFPDNYKKEGNDILIDSLDEFPFYVWANFEANIVQYGQWVVCSASYIPQNPTENLNFDFAVKRKDSLIFYSSRNFKEFYVPGDSVQHGFSSIFMGTDFVEWQKDKFECYFWNQSKKRYLLKSLDLKILDINPHKYTLWD